VIDENNVQLGILFPRDALQLGRSRDLDLVEVAPNAVPPVCRIMDYGKFRYEQSKRERDSRKTQHQVIIKELRLGPNIGEHDLMTQINSARRFFDEGHKVRFLVQFRGREMAHVEIGRKLLDHVIQELGSDIVIESPPKLEGKRMNTLVSRKPAKPAPAPRTPRTAEAQDASPNGTPPAERVAASSNGTAPAAESVAAASNGTAAPVDRVAPATPVGTPVS